MQFLWYCTSWYGMQSCSITLSMQLFHYPGWLRVSRILNLYLDKYVLRKRSSWPIWNIDNKEMNIAKTLSLDPLNVKVTLATLFVTSQYKYNRGGCRILFMEFQIRKHAKTISENFASHFHSVPNYILGDLREKGDQRSVSVQTCMLWWPMTSS